MKDNTLIQMKTGLDRCGRKSLLNHFVLGLYGGKTGEEKHF